MTEPTCVCCTRPTADGYACTSCTRRAAGQLATIVDMAPAARDVAQRQTRRGPGGGGSEQALPLNLGATQRLDAVQNTLSGWARHIIGERGDRLMLATSDLTLEIARWLPGQLEWLRHRQEVDEALADIAACARIVAGIARGPAAQRYLGPCGADLDALGAEATTVSGHCDGDVYAREGAQHGACRTCGTEVATAERRAWLDGEVRSRAFRAAQIAEAYGVNVNTIRSWAARGHLRSYWVTAGGITAEWTEPHLDETLEGEERAAREAEIADELAARGPRVHYVGDVLDLAAADAARRAGEQAKRARRAAARVAEEVSATT